MKFKIDSYEPCWVIYHGYIEAETFEEAQAKLVNHGFEAFKHDGNYIPFDLGDPYEDGMDDRFMRLHTADDNEEFVCDNYDGQGEDEEQT